MKRNMPEVQPAASDTTRPRGKGAVSLAAFKRRVAAGQRVTVVNNLYPRLSGERTVDQVQTRRLATRAEDNGVWWADWPKAPLARVEGDTLHFLSDADPRRVIFSYTFHFDAEN
ncbi:hypothetical protein [Streptantibioticus silvisoli]|uniref:Uncharacterized protein n=1 Tax=Streptantibioticus silvisoli TaxID=2705255 RepID=A0ABT6VZY7_9ACTN|nr:hypothetical protein [Streptantibioticus silvisoli]MDI5964057.1 hypothetical protein [Streptantibioticus silvisoli]